MAGFGEKRRMVAKKEWRLPEPDARSAELTASSRCARLSARRAARSRGADLRSSSAARAASMRRLWRRRPSGRSEVRPVRMA
eukprot:10262802-Lingulodinium_polyedra.AAC.1